MPISGGLAMIKSVINDLPESEKKIAAFILYNPNAVLTMTAAELGDASSTSSSAVIRLCKSLNLSGFQELKMRILGDLNSLHEASYSDIKKNDTIKSIVQSLRNNAIKSIDETLQFLNEETLKICVNLIDKADTILIYGMGASFLAAKDAQNDLVIGISTSGETRETIKLVELANLRDINTIGITKYGKSTLGKLSKYNLYTPSSIETPFRSAATASRMSQLYIIDVLFMCYATSKYDSTINYLKNTVDTIDDYKAL
jgi:DNA-binding MurR/RpiR family transcriptional regulator